MSDPYAFSLIVSSPAGNENIFTVDMGADEESAPATVHGWGSQNTSASLPKRLSKRLEQLEGRFAYDAAERQAAAERNRRAHISDVAAKARETSLKVAMAAESRKLAKGNDNFFTIEAEDDESVRKDQGWGKQTSPKLPGRLQKRCSELQEKFSYDPVERVQKADENRNAAIAARAAAAQKQVAKVAEARARKALAHGNESIMTFTFGSDDSDAVTETQGWGSQTKATASQLPPRLPKRAAFLSERFAKEGSLEERRAQAAENRAEFLRSVASKATATTDKAMFAQSKKFLQEGSENVFTVMGVDDETVESRAGWGTQSSFPTMTKRLAERASLLSERFSKSDDLSKRQEEAAQRRMVAIDSVREKARRTLAVGEKVRETKDAMDTSSNMVLMNVPQQRVLSPVKIPKRLEKRLQHLKEKFSYDSTDRERQVELNRRIHLNDVREKARKFSQRPTRTPDQVAKAAETVDFAEEESRESICESARASCLIC